MLDIKNLISMGYRRLGNSNKFAKPFGLVLYVYDFDTRLITEYFKSTSDGKMLVWSSQKCENINDLKSFECYSRPNIDTNSNFEFLNLEELCDLC